MFMVVRHLRACANPTCCAVRSTPLPSTTSEGEIAKERQELEAELADKKAEKEREEPIWLLEAELAKLRGRSRK